MTPKIRYPSGPVTPHGAYQILKGDQPLVNYQSADGSVVFNLMGGMSAPNHDRSRPECIALRKLKGLIPPWQTIDQKGATEDGVTFLDALYDPIEIDADVTAIGRDPKHTRKVIRDWIAANDVKEPGQLSWWTQELGRWWADVRWFKTPTDDLMGAQRNRQDFKWVWRGDNGFWRTYDDIQQFRISYQYAFEPFNFVTTDGLGDNWDIVYQGDGGGHIRADGQQAVWEDDPGDPVGSTGLDVIARRVGLETETDNQVVSLVIGSGYSWLYAFLARQDLWARMPTTGTFGEDGVRLRISRNFARLSSFVGGDETVLREWDMGLPPGPYDTFTLVAGYEENSRLFTVFRNGALVQSVVEPGTGSLIGEDYRGAGFGLHVGPDVEALFNRLPSGVFQWSAGDNKDATNASGFLPLVNPGDQPIFYRYTFFGPGTFYIANGPGSTDYVKFGPLLPNQIVQINSDPRDRQITDLTSIPPTPQQLNQFQQALKDFVNFATANNVPPLLQSVLSVFGIAPPQGNLYSLLGGRFSRPIAPKSPGEPVKVQHVAVSITGGNANSAVIAVGTPLRRYPA